MKTTLPRLFVLLAVALAMFAGIELSAQSTAFTYQGRLNDGGNPANGSYDLTFALFDAASAGNQFGGVITNAAWTVSNGLFTVTLDFGNQFPGADRWLEIGVRTAGGGAFATLAPRQQVTATPYAIQAANAGTATMALTAGSANSVSAANISGPIQLNQLASPVLTNNQTGVILNGDFTGNAAGLTNLLLANVALTTNNGVIAWGFNGGGQANVPPGLANVTAVAAGYVHSVARKNDGTVAVWGNGSYGQTNVPSGLKSVTAIAAGIFHSVALKDDGTVVLWGDNTYGQTNIPPGLANVTAVAAGGYFTLALKNDGTVVGWGDNNFGETNIPPGLTNVTAVAAGLYHGVALKSDGTLVAWGGNPFGETNVPSGLTNVVAIAAGAAHNLALKNDGTVVAWGDNDDGQTNVPPGLNNVAAIAAGAFHSVALKDDGTVAVWGDNSMGQTNVPPGASNIIALAQGSVAFHVLAIQRQTVSPATLVNGKVPDSSLSPDVPLLPANQTFTGANTFSNAAGAFSGAFSGDGSGLTNINAASLSGTINDARLSANVALLNGNQTFTGANFFNNTANVFGGSFNGNAAGLINLQFGAVAPTTNYGVVAWGGNFAGQTSVPAGLTNVMGTGAGLVHSIVVKKDGTVIAWGDNSYGEISVPPGLNNVKAVSAGAYYSVALKNDGTVLAWGRNDSGQTSVPPSLGNVLAVSAGFNHSLALKSDGTVVAWGDNSFGKTNVPGGLNNVRAVAAGGSHSMALKSNGTVVAWGDNNSGQASVPPGLTNVIAIAAGDEQSLALKSDGTVIGWGENGSGQAIPPPGLNNAIAVAGGALFSLALKNDGTVVAWGYDNDGETDVPLGLSNVTALASGLAGYHALVVQSGTIFAPATLVNGGIQDVSLSANVALRNGSQAFTGSNTFNNASGSFNGTFTGNGAALSSLSATNISSGTLADQRLSTNVALLNTNQTFSGSNTFSGVALLTNVNNAFVGNGSGLTGLNPANIASGTAAISISGSANTASSFSGALAGDVTGNQSATVVANVGGQTATTVANGVIAANAATSANTASTIVKRDASGSFSAGAVTATNFSGNGLGLTNLSATNISSGILADQRLSTNVALLNSNTNVFTGTNRFNNVIIGTNFNNQLAGVFTGNGGGLTSVNATNLLGTIADQRLTPNVALLNTNQTFSGSNIFSGVAVLTNLNNTLTGTHSGNGGGLTNLNATNLFGTIADQRLTPNVALLNTNQTFTGSNIFSGVAVLTNVNNTLTGTYSGNGGGLTNLNAANLFGTIADQRLTPNVALLNTNQTFSGSNIFSGVAALTNINNTLTGAHSGNGAGLTSLNAANLTGTVADQRLSANVPLLNTNQTFVGSNIFSGVAVVTNANNTLVGTHFGNGAGLTNLNTTNLFGTVSDARLSSNVALLNTNNVFTGTNRLAGVLQATNINNQLAGTFTGNGGGLTNLNASQLSSGTIPLSQLPAAVVTDNETGLTLGGTFTGNGAGLTNLAAANLTGTVADGQLSTNVALRAGGNFFTGVQEVDDTGPGPLVLDQQLTTFTGSSGSADNWQSFTAGVSGYLTSVALMVGSPTYPSSSPGTIRIYDGEGISGALLGTQSVTWQPVTSTFQTNSLSSPPYLQAGHLYTIRFSAPSITIGWVDLNSGNAYSLGRSDASASIDYPFKTFVTQAGPTVIILNPPGHAGNVGIGTSAPQAKLHVAGSFLSEGTALFSGQVTNTGTNVFSGNVIATNVNNQFAGAFTGIFTGTNLTGTNLFSAVVTATNANNQFSGTFFCPYLKFAETTANVPPGATVAGTNNFRSFNAELADTQGIGSLSGGDIVLPTGTYQCRISAPGFRVETHQIRLRTTGGLTLLWGTIGYSDSSTGGSEDRSQIDGQFTIGATTTLRVQHYCKLANASGLGTLQSFDWGDGDQYVFAVAEFWKIK